MAPLATALAVCGPTASGKTYLSISLARSLGGEVINIDSVQVYIGCDIGSAKPSMHERADIPHHLFDLVKPDIQMNAGEFRSRAKSCIAEIGARGRMPILVGGPGMYLTALLQGLAELPTTDASIRAEVAELSNSARYAELSRVDPISASRLHINDSQRVSRAVEIYRMTGVAASELVDRHRFAKPEVAALIVVICRTREDLYRRINDRARAMVAGGLIDEARAVQSAFGPVSVLDTIGYRQACQVLRGELALDECADQIALHTRHFAKRQMTYLRNEPRKRGWIARPGESSSDAQRGRMESDVIIASTHVDGFRAFEVTEGELVERIADRLRQPLLRSEVWYISLTDYRAS